MNGRPLRREGEFVLYWMHHAVRGHENPALDLANVVGNQLKRPVLVYQGLGGRHRFHSDRHHTFILQGARDVQRELAEREIGYACHVPKERGGTGPLVSLARRAALVVTEDLPAPPFPRWTRTLADRLPMALWAVDCACVIPMQTMGRSYDRAFRFRERTGDEFPKRLGSDWDDIAPTVFPFGGDLGFEPVDLSRVAIDEICAACPIDHSVGPVHHTPGGSVAGYRRWALFKREGLAAYARLRNDAAVDPPRGVSRMSPYLHHGHVSPFRIARDAAGQGSAGAEKFLDELLIWRELAHNLCFYRPDLESLSVLPGWARQTLAAHAGDGRDRVYTWETLARGETDDALWNAAQRSLLRHGELHNNLRMTWGKALLGWTRSPEEALRLLIDLNHRYALDGNDPNSYGGLLWCLGQFDRPFQPEKPVTGTVRPRPTSAHAARLDLDHYRGRVERPGAGRRWRVAVVGGGIAGLSAARTLRDQGHEVCVFEKARTVGGRTAVRRSGPFEFDHGAQYFTARDGRFDRYVASWREAGLVAPWQGRIAVLGYRARPSGPPPERYVGVPGMDAIARHLAEDLHLATGTRVSRLTPDGGRWGLTRDGGELPERFDAVIVALPPSQAAELLTGVSDLAGRVRGCSLKPCWAVLLGFESALATAFDAAFVHGSPLSWVARNTAKPGRSPAESWVLHAGPDWSAAHADDNPERVAGSLAAEFRRLVDGDGPRPPYVDAHFWPYALPPEPLEVGALWDATGRLAVCGDWCQGARIEGAFLSGMSAAGRLLSVIG
jgi:photolyase PhrII